MEKEIEKTKLILEKIKRHIEYQETIEILEKYIKELEQKEAILDRVTNKLKEDIKNNYCIEEIIGDFYIEMGIKKYLVKPYAKEILNIIEKKCNKST